MSLYLVTGPRPYRGHATGDMFEAQLDQASEDLAVRVGAIRLLERSRPGLRPGSWTLPRNWERGDEPN